MMLRVHCTDEGSPDILLSAGTESQTTMLSGGVTRDSRNMLSPLECIWLHDKPFSFSSPCQPGYLKGTMRATTNSLTVHTLTFQSSLYLNWGGTRLGYENGVYTVWDWVYREQMFIILYVCTSAHLFTFWL